MDGSIFVHLSLQEIAGLVLNAKRRVVVASPGIDAAVASALVQVSKSIGKDSVQIILDVAEDNCRVGYGNIDGYCILFEEDLPVRRCSGLRIGFVLADDTGYLFGMPPLMVEAPGKFHGCPNAIRALPDQIESLVLATARPDPVILDKHDGKNPQSMLPLSGRSTEPEIGLQAVSKSDVDQIESSIRNNPVQNFDLARVVRVFNALVQFVEFRVEGTKLESHTVTLPNQLLTIVRDEQVRSRLTAAFKMVSEGSRLTGNKIEAAAAKIRKRFLKPNANYGSVMLKAKRTEFESEVERLREDLKAHKKTVRDRYSREVEESKKSLTQAFWRAVRASPPPDLVSQISGPKPSMEEAKDYLAAMLARSFPSVEKVCEAMKITLITKDVTWETLNSPHFIDWLANAFPVNKELIKPFDEYRAARQRLDMTAAATIAKR